MAPKREHRSKNLTPQWWPLGSTIIHRTWIENSWTLLYEHSLMPDKLMNIAWCIRISLMFHRQKLGGSYLSFNKIWSASKSNGSLYFESYYGQKSYQVRKKKGKKRFLPKSRKIEKSVFFFLAGRKNGEMEYYGEYLVKYLCVGWLQYVLSANGRLL